MKTNTIKNSTTVKELISAIEEIEQPITAIECIAIYNAAEAKIKELEPSPLNEVFIICELNDLELEEHNDENAKEQKDAILLKLKWLLHTSNLLEEAKAWVLVEAENRTAKLEKEIQKKN